MKALRIGSRELSRDFAWLCHAPWQAPRLLDVSIPVAEYPTSSGTSRVCWPSAGSAMSATWRCCTRSMRNDLRQCLGATKLEHWTSRHQILPAPGVYVAAITVFVISVSL